MEDESSALQPLTLAPGDTQSRVMRNSYGTPQNALSIPFCGSSSTLIVNDELKPAVGMIFEDEDAAGGERSRGRWRRQLAWVVSGAGYGGRPWRRREEDNPNPTYD